MSTTGGTWNYRVVRRPRGDGSTGESFLAIREAHYGEDKERPESITQEPTIVTGDTPEELTAELDRVREALSKPVLEYDDF